MRRDTTASPSDSSSVGSVAVAVAEDGVGDCVAGCLPFPLVVGGRFASLMSMGACANSSVVSGGSSNPPAACCVYCPCADRKVSPGWVVVALFAAAVEEDEEVSWVYWCAAERAAVDAALLLGLLVMELPLRRCASAEEAPEKAFRARPAAED